MSETYRCPKLRPLGYYKAEALELREELRLKTEELDLWKFELRKENDKLRKANERLQQLDEERSVVHKIEYIPPFDTEEILAKLRKENNDLKEAVIQASVSSGQFEIDTLTEQFDRMDKERKSFVHELSGLLEGDLSYNNVAKAKQIIKRAITTLDGRPTWKGRYVRWGEPLH